MAGRPEATVEKGRSTNRWARRLLAVSVPVLVTIFGVQAVRGDDSILYADEAIYPDSGVYSPNGQVVLWYQASGYLSLWVNGSMVWGAQHAPGQNGGVAIMQGDGNFVTYDPNWVPYWDSVTWENPGAYLAVQDDGRAVIYAPDGRELWAAPGLPEFGLYCAMPVVHELEINDAHESWFGGSKAYMYFSDGGGAPKTGNLPSMVGDQSIDTDAWASNMQGPWYVPGSRKQWEWASNGSASSVGQYSWISPRVYPIIYKTCVFGRNNFQTQRTHEVIEHDEGTWDDYVGQIKIDPWHCNTNIFDRGLAEGWTFGQIETPGLGSIVRTRYRLWCYSPTYGGDLVR
jgi:hypothetical protein